MTIIHLCDAAWRIYDSRRWKALDKHRVTCGHCTKPRNNIDNTE